VDVRGRAMAQAGAERPGAMAAVIGLPPEQVARTCAPLREVWIANVNSPAQIVVSGARDEIERAADLLTEAGARLVVPLPIAIACHTPLMAPAAERLRATLKRIELRRPRLAFYSAVSATPQDDVAEIARSLVDGITAPVRFAETVRRMRDDGVNGFLEVGPGRVLRGLLRENAPELPNDAIAGFHYAVPS
jgi:[acyl-carrier-protein] S-malonyltransferase